MGCTASVSVATQTWYFSTKEASVHKPCIFAEDMAKFVDNYPEYRKMQGNVSKHVTLVTEMSKIVEERKLMLVSQTEQELACNGGQGAAFEVVCSFRLKHNILISYGKICGELE